MYLEVICLFLKVCFNVVGKLDVLLIWDGLLDFNEQENIWDDCCK